MIWTFYSFKGGAGRSMALANVAEHLYRQGLRVAMVDWDLEAPGLESFFFRAADELKPIRSQLGLMDVLLAYKRQFPLLSLPPREEGPGKVLRVLHEELPPLSGILYPIQGPEPTAPSEKPAMWILTAGWRGGDRFPDYVQAVQSFDWTEFYASFHGEAFFEWMRRQLLNEVGADVVLIDSRTGATEMGGVCTRQLADVVVAFCVPNLQNLVDTATLTDSFLKPEVIKARGRPLQVVVVPSRIENSEIDARNRFKHEFQDRLERFTPPSLRRVGVQFWDLRIPYISKYAYLASLAVGAADSAEELETAYRTLATTLATLAPDSSRLRRVAAAVLIGAPRGIAAEEALPVVWNVPARRNPGFVARDRELAGVRTALTTASAYPAVVAVTGLGGVGKSSLAAEYAYRFSADYDLVWWISAEDRGGCVRGYQGLAEVLGLPEGSDPDLAIPAVARWLGHNSRWLLVFDNAQDPGSTAAYLPREGFGHVMISSRNPNWRRIARIVELEAFSQRDAAAYLTQRLGTADPATDALAEALGGLPLAVEQAAAYIEATGLSVADYLERFRKHEARLLARGDVLGYPGSVATAWRLSFDRVQSLSPAAAELLYLFAFLAPDAIPLAVVVDGAALLPEPLAATVSDALGLEEAVAVLRSHSLVRVDGESVSVHRLVQAVTRDRLDQAEASEWAAATVRIVDRSFPADGRDPVNWPACARLLAHALAATGHAQDLGAEPGATVSLLSDVGVYLHARGDLAAAQQALERAVTLAREASGPRHPAIVKAATALAMLVGGAPGGPVTGAAVGAAAGALAAARGIYKPGQPELVRALTAVGAVRLAAGDPDGAMQAQQEAREMARASLGPDHPDTLRVEGNLAQVLWVRRNLEEARALQEAVLDGRTRVLGPDHPDTIDAMAALATTIDGQGDHQAARQLREQVLEARTRVLGPDHPETRATAALLAKPAAPM